METKKSPKKDLNNKRSLFFEIGMVAALGLALAMFDYSTKDLSYSLDGRIDQGPDVDIEYLPITRIEDPEPPARPKIQLADVIEIIDTDEGLEDDIDFSSEIEEIQPEYSFPVAIDPEPEDDSDSIFVTWTKPPTFNGDLQEYLKKNIKYPAIAEANGVFGRVFVQFVIDQNGRVCDVHPTRQGDVNLDREAVRVVESMPNWTPGENRGRPVKVMYTIPINFVLQ